MFRRSIKTSRISDRFYTKSRKLSRDTQELHDAGWHVAGQWGSRNHAWSQPQSLSLLISKLASEWRDAPLNLGMYLSPEGRESVEMVSSSLSKIYKSAIALKKGNFGGFLKELRPLPRPSKRKSYKKFTQGDLSGSFLAAHLGWEPLIKDAYSAATFKPSPLKSQAISVSIKDIPGSVTVTAPWVDTGKAWGVQKLIAKVVRQPTFYERFGMDNPFLIAWELVPLSFVADYFLPIGATIDALGFVGSCSTSDVILTHYRRVESNIRYPAYTIGWKADLLYEYYYDDQERSYVEKIEWFKRSNVSLTLASPLDWKVSLPKSLMRLATMGSLLHQALLNLR
jgi:hypothetical protein